MVEKYWSFVVVAAIGFQLYNCTHYRRLGIIVAVCKPRVPERHGTIWRNGALLGLFTIHTALRISRNEIVIFIIYPKKVRACRACCMFCCQFLSLPYNNCEPTIVKAAIACKLTTLLPLLYSYTQHTHSVDFVGFVFNFFFFLIRFQIHSAACCALCIQFSLLYSGLNALEKRVRSTYV